MTVPSTIPAASARAWYDEHHVDDVALYDITRQAATLLSSILLARKQAAGDELEQEHWAARRRLVKRQAAALNPEDRAELVAQQQAWAHEIQALDAQPVPQPA
ncbi:MAG TPA: hypothetical protein VNR37_09195 [Microbacteriaceae bacterium]|nr:hypothetical protein [Microbacteriaceae bacterium]